MRLFCNYIHRILNSTIQHIPNLWNLLSISPTTYSICNFQVKKIMQEIWPASSSSFYFSDGPVVAFLLYISSTSFRFFHNVFPTVDISALPPTMFYFYVLLVTVPTPIRQFWPETWSNCRVTNLSVFQRASCTLYTLSSAAPIANSVLTNIFLDFIKLEKFSKATACKHMLHYPFFFSEGHYWSDHCPKSSWRLLLTATFMVK